MRFSQTGIESDVLGRVSGVPLEVYFSSHFFDQRFLDVRDDIHAEPIPSDRDPVFGNTNQLSSLTVRMSRPIDKDASVSDSIGSRPRENFDERRIDFSRFHGS